MSFIKNTMVEAEKTEYSMADDAAYLAQRLCEFDRLENPVWVWDFDSTCILWCNDSALTVWQADSKEQLMRRNMGSDMSPSVSKRLNQYQTDFGKNKTVKFREVWTVYPNGKPKTLNVVYSALWLSNGRLCMLCDSSVEKAMDADTLRSAEALLHTSVQISLFSSSGVPLYRNPAARNNALGGDNTLEEHFADSDLLRQLNDLEQDEIEAITSVNTVNGVVWHDITARRCLDAVSGEAAWLISEVDVSRLKATEERAQFFADHDILTKLPNRSYVSNYFQKQIDEVLDEGKSGYLVFLDLDNFKYVNDSLGHDAGDQLLVEVASRLKSIASSDNSVARLGGDEFLLLLCPTDNENQFEETLHNILGVVSLPVILHGRELQVTPSVGVASFPYNGTKIAELMRHADLAMYHAKETGKNDFAFFSKDLSDVVDSKMNLVSELRFALKSGQFETYYQPRVCVESNSIVGAEALARWNHPTRGVVLPDTFIPVCEESGLIAELGKLIFTQAVIAQRIWAEQGNDIRVSVNLSPLQFNEESLVDDLLEIVDQHGGNPKKIELEITESVLMGHDECTIEKLHRLVQCGFEIAIDDFGTGYSSLAYLHRYPISCLKIDKSFINQMDSAKPIIELIVSMAKLFKLYIVAEGVETRYQLDLLQSYECEEYQGYLFHKPVVFDSFVTLLSGSADKAA